MKKKFVRLISAVLSAAMTLTAVPLSAFAEGEEHTHDGEGNVITTPLDFREKTADENGDGWSWDYDTKTLTLDGVNIQATTDSMSVVTVPDGTEIVLNGKNTIVQTDTGDSYTYVLSAVNNQEVNCDGTMTISGDGVLNAENRSTDSMARSLGGTIILNGGTVNATGKVVAESLEIHNDGALNAEASAVSNDGAAVGVKRGITVDGNGSLTAVGGAVENEYVNNGAILLNSNFGDKISVSGNGSITVPEGNAAKVGIYYDGNKSIDAEISGGKVTAYGTKCGIYKVNLIMSGTGSVYATGGTYGIGQTVPTIDEDEFVIKGSTEFKAEESSVTANAKYNSGYYEIDGADAKTVVIKPDTSPRIILGKQTGIFKTEEYELIEDIDMTETKLKGTVYFDITLKNMSDEEFADARGYFGGDEPDLSASIIKTDYGWVCMVCDTEFSTTYDTDNTLTIKCGDIVSNTVQVKSNANRFNKVTQGDNTNRTVFYTNTSQEEKDNYKLVSTYTVDSESISYNWYSMNSAYSADELGAAVSGTGGEFKLADNIPAGNYVLYCDITYSDGDSTETVTEKFTFTYKECAHENGYSDGKCTNCGALCDHSDIDIGTGKCNECERQFVATISTDGSAPIGYDTLKDCLDSITADTGNYVKIYQDIGDATATLDTIDVKHNVMIDLNGHKLNNIKLGVNKDVKLALTGTEGSYVTQVYVRNGGSFVIDSAANAKFNTIFVEADAGLAVNDGAKVTTEQLTVIASVADDGTTTTSVKLATGMKLGELSYYSQNSSGVVKLGNLLDVTRQALQRDDNGEYLDLYKEYGGMGYPFAFTVVEHTDADHTYSDGTGKCEKCGKPCEHSGDINTDTGICSICGAVVSVAIYTDANGISKYVDADELHSLLNEYNGSGTVKLFKDYSKPSAQYDLYGELTIDLNGRQFKIRSITPCKNGKLTIKNSGNPVMLGCNVYPTNDASYAGGTLIIDGDIILDTAIYVYDSSTVILKDGTYHAGLYARDSKTLYDMLGEGKAFFKTDGTLFNASVKEISSSVTLIVKDHSHTYVDGKCECGYVCSHSDVDIDTGKCTECEYQYAAVIVKDGAVASVYKETEMVAAFEAADSDANTGCTLKVYKNYTGSYTTLSGKFTLWIAEEANVGKLTVSGDITVTGSEKNNSIYGDFDVADGGKLTFDENCGAKGIVSVGAGTFDCYYSLDITLNINDASSDVILHYGTFRKICYNGGGDRANAEILTLLAENRMFMKRYGEPIDGSKTLLKDGFATIVIVIPHEGHSYDSTTGKCKMCGKRCGHTDVDSETGVCPVCKYQLTAGVSGVGTEDYFDNIDDAFTAALSEVNSGCTLTLYKDCELSQNIVIGNATVTLDVNGHSILLAYRIKVNDGGVLYLKNSRENGSIDTEIEVNKGGTLINGTADDSRSAVSVFGVTADAAKRVEIYGGSYVGLTVNNGTSGIALYGGSYESINTNDLTDSTPVSALLAKGYAFATLNSVTHLPESIVDGSATNLNPGLENVAVLAHTHTYTETNTKCDCGAVLYAKVTSADGTSNKYFDSIEEGLLYADKAENKGCVFTLVTTGGLENDITLSSGQFTITAIDDNYINAYTRKINIKGAEITVENCAFNCFVGLYSGSLTYPEGSTSVCINGISVFGGTLNISDGVSENFGANKFTISDTATDAKVTIGGGIYSEIKLGQYTFKDILASGTRLISVEYSQEIIATNELLYSIVSEQNTLGVDDDKDYRFVKCDHKNEDGSYAFNEGGICKYCNSEFAASVSYTDGGEKTELFGDIIDAFDKANEIGTATVTLYKNIENSEFTREITVTGNVTLNLNGKTLGGAGGTNMQVSDGGTLTVDGDGDLQMFINVNENSKSVINGGELTYVRVYEEGNAEIKGGVINYLEIYGNAKISGGKFNIIKTANGSLESVLADGYAYKKNGGSWLSIAERAEKEYNSSDNDGRPVNVEEAPIKSASIAWADEEAPVVYRNGDKYLRVNAMTGVAKSLEYSDFANGNMLTTGGTVSFSGVIDFSGVAVGNVKVPDGEVEYYCIFTRNGYEYKTNTLKFTLATCSHPEDSFTEKDSNGWVRCGICDLRIEAQVIAADGELLGYASVYQAIQLARENEGSTVKLISERVSTTMAVTVTGSKFTVDFNGKEAYYQFDVYGGDVTFTSSAVQDVNRNDLQSAININRADAKVTIDGKIKLKKVKLTSGTLKINSTDGYIGELSINGGNAVIDNAIIGALQTNSGDTVINCVEADSLSMNFNGSGSISIVTGTFGSTTCERDSGYTLGMAIASGSAVLADSMNGITVYTYDAIQTMTSTYRIFVDKCSHKDGKGSYVLDGTPCPYCNEEIVATVSYTAGKSEETELFSDIYDAFERANEIGTATVTLYKDIENSITETIAVTGNVTVELNGKKLSTPGFDPFYAIEVKSGKLTVNGSGTIKRAVVRNGGDAEINGGTFSDFRIEDGGNAVINGGKFNSIKVSGEGRNVGQLLADGYAYKNFDGFWSTVAEREKQDITNVEVKEAPIKSATATVDKTVLYRNGGGARQILFNFNVNTSDGYTISDANKVTVGLYVGDTLIRELDFVGNSYTFANADEISDTDGTVKAHLVIKLNGYEYVTDDVEFEMATCTHPYDALTTDEYDYYRCSLCDASINAILVKTNGDKACYTDNVPEAFEAAQLEENNGCTLELYRGVNRDCKITQGSFTVLFKKTGSASAVIKVSGGNVKITGDDGCTLSKYPGSSVGYLIAVTGGMVTFDDITINDDSISVSGGKTVINGGTYNKLSVSGGTVTINSGTFSSIDVSAEGKALKDLLGENKAFTTSDGKLFDASKVSESDMSLTVIDHSKHEYDETGRCGCGYQCAHSEINAEGVCNECNAKMYVAVTVKSETGTTVKYFTKLTEAFEFAAKNENKGCTLKMLRDFFDRNTDINVNGGELTVDMNGFGVYFNSFNGSGTQITIRSDSKCTFGVENGFSMDGGTVTFSGEVSVVCQNVKLNATYFSSYVETLKIDTLILEDGVLLKQLASITNANIANIDCSSEIYLYQILASGSRVDSQLYSDLKANASSNFDNVRIIRCDHPDGVGRDNRCIYCNSLIAASVSYTENGAEKTEYFVKEDLGKAFAKANSVAIATITMLMSSAYDTDYLPVTGDVTLIANGDNAILYNTVKVADGGKLTLRGNANIFAVIAEPGSRLTAEEATRIAYLTVNGGDVKLSGGQYDNITVKDGKITDILGNGYAYKKTEGGAWLTLKEREVSEASGVTVAKAPIVQATLSTEINKLYRNSNANPTLKFNLALAHGSNLNDSYVSKRYSINSYVSGDIIYSSLSALVTDAKLSADEIIDKAGDSDVAEIYFVVTTGDGYEIKSNTVSIDLVDCDHSQVVDPTADKETAGNITEPTYCEICESKFNAKITKGDDVRYYNDLDEAAKDAQKSENEGCILYPLYNKNGYGGQLVITEGNFTLKYAVRTAFSRPIIINGKAKLTVTGRCAVTAFENQDAFIVQGGDVTFEGLATGSNVTINGGNVTMAANNINCLTINGGNVSISSGGFAEIITNAPNKVIADYIDPGFWVQDRGTKEWIDIYSLNKATASSTNGLTVRLCPMQIIKPIDTVYYTNGYYPGDIPSLQINAEPWYSNEVDADVAYQWIGIDENGNETEIEGATDRKLSLENLTTGRYYCRLTYSNATTAGVSMKSDVVTATITECEHSGGEATCTKKAKCEICGAEYGETKPHSYAQIKSPEYLKSAATCTAKAVYYTSCTECGQSSKGTADEATFEYGDALGHKYGEWVSNGDGTHTRVCANDSTHIETKACHGGKATCTAKAICEDCGAEYGEMTAHAFTAKTASDKYLKSAATCTAKAVYYTSCAECGLSSKGTDDEAVFEYGNFGHKFTQWKGTDANCTENGYKERHCTECDYKQTQTIKAKGHQFGEWKVTKKAGCLTDGEQTAVCTVCNHKETKVIAATGHKYDTSTVDPTYSEKGYTLYKCRLCGSSYKSNFTDILEMPAAEGFKKDSATDTTVTLKWDRYADADGYIVEWYIDNEWKSKRIEGNENVSLTLDGLNADSVYKVRIRAYSGDNYSDYIYLNVSTTSSTITDDPSKDNANTGAEGIAIVVDVAILATGTLIITKKRRK